MTFGLDKCATATFIRGKLKSSSSIQRDIDTKIKELDQEEAYKYLGIEEGDGIQHGKMKENVRKECYRRVRAVLESEFNAKIRSHQHISNPCCIIQFQCSQLESRRNKENR